jgi:hypothetical protein
LAGARHPTHGDAGLARWATTEPAQAGVATVADLVAACSETGEWERSNVVLAALVRLAALDGGAATMRWRCSCTC